MLPAQPEQLEPVGVDQVAAVPRDFCDYLLEAAVRHLSRLAAAATDDVVVVMLRLAGDVRVLARWKVEAFESPELGEKVEVAEEGGPADLHAPSAGHVKQLGRREVTGSAVDELGHSAASPGHSVSGTCEVDIQCHK